MWNYVGRRVAQALVILFIITIACFMLTRLSSDPMAQYALKQGMTAADRDRLRHSMGLDITIPPAWIHWMGLPADVEASIIEKSGLPVQYAIWLGLALRGDLGQSLFYHQPVSLLLSQRLPMTLILMGVAEIFIVAVAVFFGVISAVKQYSLTDNVITSFSFIGFSMPIFFIALGMMQIFAVQFKAWHLPYFPTRGDVWNFKDPVALAWHLGLPVSCLAIIQVAGYSRSLRSSLL